MTAGNGPVPLGSCTLAEKLVVRPSSLTSTVMREEVTVPVVLSARRVTGVGDVAGGILANLRVEGLLKVTGMALTGEGLDLTSEKLKGKLSLFVDLITGRFDVVLSGGLTRYLIPGLGIVGRADRREHGRRLLAAHHRDPGVGPQEQEAG